MLTLEFERLGIRSGDVVLDLGCGNGRHTFEALKRGAHVIAADLKPEVLTHVSGWVAAMYEEGQIPSGTGFVALRADALHLPLPDGSLDHVIASEILEHIPQDEAAIAEIARVLKPGATAGVSVPRYWPERVCWALSREYRASAGGHVRIYRADDLANKLGLRGLQLEGRDHAHALHSPYWWLKCAFGVDKEDARVPQLYHRFLVWQITKRPPSVDALERALDPILGKSLVLYARKNGTMS